MSGHDIEDAIKREFSGNVEKGFLSIAKVVKSKVDFFAEKLHDSMAGLGKLKIPYLIRDKINQKLNFLGTNDKTLIRIIVSRSEIDLGDIKEAFAAKYGKSLESWVKVIIIVHFALLFFFIFVFMLKISIIVERAIIMNNIHTFLVIAC